MSIRTPIHTESAPKAIGPYSQAITAGAPRRKANGFCSIRPKRIGASSGNRPAFDRSSIDTTSPPAWRAVQSPCNVRGTVCRSALPDC